MVTLDIWTVVVALGIPSAITGLGFWAVTRVIQKSDARREVKEKSREESQMITIRSTCAALVLGIVTGETILKEHNDLTVSKPIEAAKDALKEQGDFWQRQGVHNVMRQ